MTKADFRPKIGGNPTHFKDRIIKRLDFLMSAVLLSNGPDESCKCEHFESSPLQENEIRPADLETKNETSQTEEEVESQLKVNMMLHCVQLYIKKIEALDKDSSVALDEVRNVEIISSYGISFGVNVPTVILKLVMNFESGTIEYTRKFRGGQHYNVVELNWAIHYVVARMKGSGQVPTAT